MFKFLEKLFLQKKQTAPSVNASFLDKNETKLRRQRLYEILVRSDVSHEIQSDIYFNLAPDNLSRFQGAFFGVPFRPKKNDGDLLYPNEEKFIYLIELNGDDELGPVFYESKIFDSVEEAENDRWILKSKVYRKSVQQIKADEEKEEADKNPYYHFNLSKKLYDSGIWEPEELKSHLTIALTKNISPNSKAWTLKTLGTIYLDQNNFDKAKVSFEEALRLNPKIGVKSLLKKLDGRSQR